MAVRIRAQAPLNLGIKLQPKELELFRLMERDDCSLIGYGGAKGGAKSHGLRSCMILRRLKYPGTRGLIFRRNYDDLWQQHIQMIAEEWPELYERYWSAENKALMLPGRSMLLFRYADTLKDIMKFRGKEYGDVGIDEATELEETELKILYSSCRTTVDGVEVPDGQGGTAWQAFTPKKILTFNPGGVGHGYVKRVFVDKQPTPEEAIQNPQFIQAYAWDNVMWVRKALKADGFTVRDYRSWETSRQIEYLVTRSDYGKELNALPELLRKPWLYGDWDTFSGQAFSEWRRPVHVVPAFKIPAHWTRWLANDPGFKDWSMWYWFAASEDGQVFCYRERRYTETTASEQGKDVAAICKAAGERPQFIVTGMDAFVIKDRSVGKTEVDYYEGAGLSGFVEPVHGAGARASRAKTVHEYLRPYEVPADPAKPELGMRSTARVQVFDLCPILISTLPALPMDENDPEAVKECDIDHPYDAFGYGLQAWHARRSKAPTKPRFERGTAGDILKHAEKLGDKPKRKVLE